MRPAGEVNVRLGLVLAALLIAAASRAGTVITPGGTIRDLVADPVRPVFYATLDTGELVTIDIATAAVSNRVPLPGDPGALAVAPDGSRMWIALRDSFDLAVLDLPPATATVLPLSATSEPTDVVAGTSRVYAVSWTGMSIVDAVSGAETWVPSRDFYDSLLALSPDESRLYSLDRGICSGSLHAYEVCDERLHAVSGCSSCGGCNGTTIATTPDGSALLIGAGSPYRFQILPTEGAVADLGAILSGPYPRALAVSHDGRRAYLSHQVGNEVLFADLASRLAFHAEPLSADADILALSADDATLAAVVEGPLTYDRIELVDVRGPLPNRGGILLRPVDAVTGNAIADALVSEPIFEGDSAPVDPARNLIGRAPVRPGLYSVSMTASGYNTAVLTARVEEGTWTDLGTVPFTRSGAPAAPSGVGAVPTIDAGSTRALTVYGHGFAPGATVTSLSTDILVDRAAYRDPGRIDVTLTALPIAVPGARLGLRVSLVDGRSSVGTLWVREGACPFTLAVPDHVVLLAVKTLPSDVTLLWDDTAVDAGHDAADDYLAFRSVTLATSGYASLGVLPNTAALRESFADPGALGSASPLSATHFYKLSARNAAGDSRDVP